ncbi:MAG: hypothetical protein ABI378_11440 [Chitinophagaceae bacterium]
MAKAQKPTKERPKKYDDKLAVKGSFMDVIKASVKDAENKGKDKAKKPE